MSEYIVQHDTMVGIADAIRTMTGTADKLSPDQIATSVTAGNTEVDTQSDLIAQISAALDGKAAGGSGGSVETCSVSVSFSAGYPTPIIATTVTDGVFDSFVHTQTDQTLETITIDNVLCGSVVYVGIGGLGVIGCTISGAERLDTSSNGGTFYPYQTVVKMPQEPGANVTIEIYDND